MANCGRIISIGPMCAGGTGISKLIAGFERRSQLQVKDTWRTWAGGGAEENRSADGKRASIFQDEHF